MVKVLNLDKLPKYYIRFDGKKYMFRDLGLEDDLKIKEVLDKIAKAEDEESMTRYVREYVDIIIDLPGDVLDNIMPNHFLLIRGYIERLPLYVKGFSDKEIDLLERATALREAHGIIDMASE